MSGPAAILDIYGTLVDSNSVMIGDSTWDCRANAGVETTAVLAGGFSDEERREAGAVAVFESIDELRRRLSETPLG